MRRRPAMLGGIYDDGEDVDDEPVVITSGEQLDMLFAKIESSPPPAALRLLAQARFPALPHSQLKPKLTNGMTKIASSARMVLAHLKTEPETVSAANARADAAEARAEELLRRVKEAERERDEAREALASRELEEFRLGADGTFRPSSFTAARGLVCRRCDREPTDAEKFHTCTEHRLEVDEAHQRVRGYASELRPRI